MLSIGDPAPNFTVKDHEGRLVRLSELSGRRFVLYFYPKADTPGCTAQSCAFRDRMEEFREKEVEVLGVSFDSLEENKAFAEKNGFPFRLLCDTDRKIGLAYHACAGPQDEHARRITYVVDSGGRIEQAIETEDPGSQAGELLGLL